TGSSDCNWIVRGVAKKVGSKVMMVRIELLWLDIAARNEPVPESFALVTTRVRVGGKEEPPGAKGTATPLVDSKAPISAAPPDTRASPRWSRASPLGLEP